MSHLFRSSVLLAFFFGFEKILGFIRQVAIARQFGLSVELDAFNAANNLPELIFVLISGGALAIAFIPVLSQYLETKGRPATWELFSRVMNLMFLLTAGLSLLIAIFAEPIVRAEVGIAPGFGPEQQDLVADLMRLNLIATLIFSVSGLVMAGLQANQHFLLPAMAPAMYDIGMLFGVLVLAPDQPYQFGPLMLPYYGMGVHGLVYGTILGALLFLGIQVPGLLYYRFRWSPLVGLRDTGVAQVISLMGPRVLTVFCIQLIFIAQDNFASRVGEGAVTALVYGWLFMQVPETLIGTALGTAVLPTLSEQIVRRQLEKFRETLNHTLRIILALALPSAVLISIVIRPVIGILGFGAEGTEVVVWTSRAFLAGLVGHALLEVAVRAFYARQNARTPLLTAASTLGAFVLVGALLFPVLGAPGIALANAIVFTGQALLLLWLTHRRYGGVLNIGTPLLRIAFATALGGTITYLSFSFLLGLWAPLLLQILGGGIALVLGALVVLPFIWKQELSIFVRL